MTKVLNRPELTFGQSTKAGEHRFLFHIHMDGRMEFPEFYTHAEAKKAIEELTKFVNDRTLISQTRN